MEVYKQEIFNPIYQVFNENHLIVNDNETDEKKKNTCEVFTSFLKIWNYLYRSIMKFILILTMICVR